MRAKPIFLECDALIDEAITGEAFLELADVIADSPRDVQEHVLMRLSQEGVAAWADDVRARLADVCAELLRSKVKALVLVASDTLRVMPATDRLRFVPAWVRAARARYAAFPRGGAPTVKPLFDVLDKGLDQDVADRAAFVDAVAATDIIPQQTDPLFRKLIDRIRVDAPRVERLHRLIEDAQARKLEIRDAALPRVKRFATRRPSSL